MNEFDRAGIPFYMKDADNRFFSHWVVEDILNFLRMTFTDKRPELFIKVCRKMNGYLTGRQVERLLELGGGQSVFDTLLTRVPLKDYQIKPLESARETFGRMAGMPPLAAIRLIRSRLGYEKAIEKMCERLGFRKEYLIGILNTLEEIADTLETMEAFAARLKHLETALRTSKFNKNTNAVTFSTLHSAKGLEFEQVYMIDLIDGILPSADDRKKDAEGERGQMEEAVRLFYVGMTRAKSRLELLLYKERDGELVKESDFVTHVRHLQRPAKPGAGTGQAARAADSSGLRREGEPRAGTRQSEHRGGPAAVRQRPEFRGTVSPEALRTREELTAGRAVRHTAFGAGQIVEVKGEQVRVRFGETEKALLIAACLERGLLERLTGEDGQPLDEGGDGARRMRLTSS